MLWLRGQTGQDENNRLTQRFIIYHDMSHYDILQDGRFVVKRKYWRGVRSRIAVVASKLSSQRKRILTKLEVIRFSDTEPLPGCSERQIYLRRRFPSGPVKEAGEVASSSLGPRWPSMRCRASIRHAQRPLDGFKIHRANVRILPRFSCMP